MADRLFQRLRRFLRELKRRNIYRVAATYAAVAFVTLQAARLIFPATTLQGVYDVLVVIAFVGFPLAIVLAWAFEVTPEGVRRTAEADPTDGDAEEATAQTAAGYKVLVGLGLLATAVAGGWYLTGGGGDSPEVTERTVAVLPFQVSGPGTEEWREGMVTMLGTGLDGAAGLRAIADQTVLAGWDRAGASTGDPNTPRFLKAARRVGAEYAVVGSAVKLGGELRLSADVHETASGERLGQVEVQGAPNRVTALTDTLTRRVLAVLLKRSEQDLPSVDLASLTTSSLPALKSYLRGERHFRAGQYEAAIDDFEAAVAEDSAFALAYARLARSHAWLDEDKPSYWKRAYRYSNRLPERERRIVRTQYIRNVKGRDMAAADTFRRLSDQYPDDPTIWYTLGETVFHGAIPRGWPETETFFKRAVELDPGVAPYHHHLVDLAFAVHHDSALAADRIAAFPDTAGKPLYRLAWDIVFGSDARRENAFARLDTISIPRLFYPGFALAHPTNGDLAEQVFRRLLHRDDHRDERFAQRLFITELRQGQLEDASSVARERSLGDDWQACLIAYEMTLGIPFPDSVARRHLEPENLSSIPSTGRLQCTGLYLIEQGRARAASKLMGQVRARIDTSGAPRPDAEGARRALKQLRGYRAWTAGDLAQAADLWSGFNDGFLAGAIWRGDLYRQLDQLETAEGWYLAGWRHPVAHERLGQLYEEMDESEKAAAAYRRFIAAWENADEELQPRVEAARKRLEKLTASQSETDG